MWTSEPEGREVREGAELRLACRAGGSPPPIVTWSREAGRYRRVWLSAGDTLVSKWMSRVSYRLIDNFIYPV